MEQDGWDSWDPSPDELPVASAWPGGGAWPESPARARTDSAAEGGVTVRETSVIDCGICWLPLKPPIFQCEVGHVVCAACCVKLRETGKCHVCNIPIVEYKRCFAMEHVVESIDVRCPNAIYGCSDKAAYYDQRNHRQMCAHAPCYCPGVTCDFIGSKAALWDHFSGVHGWPRSKGRVSKGFDIVIQDGLAAMCECMNLITLQDGFNFLLADTASDGRCATTTANSQYLFLLNVARQPLGRAISILCIDPHATTGAANGQGPSTKEVKCDLSYTGHGDRHPRGCDQVIEHYQKSRFRVACTDLSNGLSSLDGHFQFLVPHSVAADIDRDTIQVTARIVIE